MTEARVVVITGASSGIGRDLARAAAGKGYAVVAVARRADRLAQLAAEIGSAGGKIATIVADVTQPDAPKRIVSETLARFGRLDVLVHNAGSAVAGGLLSQTDAQIDGQWQLHVAAPLRITREAFPTLQKQRGQVIFIGSGVDQIPLPYYGAYCAAKAAMRAAAVQLRREVRDTGIAITYIDPGTVATEFSLASGTRSAMPHRLLAKSDYVAKRILQAMQSRPARMSAVRWQGAIVTLGGLFPRLTDLALARVYRNISHREPHSHREPISHREPANDREARPSGPERSRGVTETRSSFDAALAPVEKRMERLKLSRAFLQQLLEPGATIRLNEAAMSWAGMPNKNERAVLLEALEALASAGFLESTGEETWRVLRAANEP